MVNGRQSGKSKAKKDPSSLHKGPCFYKVIFEKHETLLNKRIPPDFMKKHGSKLRRRKHVNLVVPCGNQKASLHHEEEDSGCNTYFHEEGWRDFRRTHSLGNGEFLIFEYDGRMSFNVTIFEGSGIMRTYGEVGSLGRVMPCPQSHGEKQKVPRNTGIRIEEVKIEEGDSKDGIVGKNTISTSKGRKHLQEERTVNLLCKNHPFTTICLNSSNVNTIFLLQIPRSFSQYFYYDGRRAKMILRNSEGKQWMVNAVENNNNWAFSGGWRKFVKDNKLKEGDTCTFELVEQNMVHVHINRSG